MISATLVSQALGGAALFLLAWLAARLARRRSAATRALIWSAAVAAVLVLPLLSALLPAVEVEVLPAAPPPEAGQTAARRAAATPTAGLNPAPERTMAATLPPTGIDGARTVAAETGSAAHVGGHETTVAGLAPGAALGIVALAVWGLGALALTLQLLVGVLRVRGIERRAVAVRDPGLKGAFARAATRLRLTRHVELLETDELQVPATWHLRRPCVLVPRQMAGWDAERQEAVLIHELAHVRRGDGRLQLLAQAVAALHWFDPFCWVALAGLRREREQACDDAVLAAGVRPTTYATHLLEIARSSHRYPPAFLPAMSLLRGTALAGRVRAILDPMTGRRSPDRRTTLSIISLTFLLTLPLAALQPVAAQQAPEAPTTTPAAPAAAPAPATAPAPAQEPRPSIEELVQMRIHGITPEYVEEMAAFLGRDMDIDELVSLRIHGATPEFGREMAALLGPVDAADLVQMRIHGVSAELAEELESILGRELDTDDLVTARIHGLKPEFAREMRGMLGEELALSDLVQMRIHGLSTDEARKLRQLLPDESLDADRMVEFRIHGVTAELVQRLRDAGYTDLTAEELVKIRIHGMERVMLRRDGGR